MKLKRNMNKLDQGVRLIFGASLVFAGFVLIESQLISILIIIFGIINLVSGATSHCPVYAAIGVSSLSVRDEGKADAADDEKTDTP
jgi:hypothetical protein